VMYEARLEMAVREQVVGVRVPLELWVQTGYAEDLADIFKSYSMGVWDIPESKIVLREEAMFMSQLNYRLDDLRLIVQKEREKV
jgi:hypothetical protein